MAKQTFTQLQNTTKDFISQSSGSVNTSTISNFVKEHLNKGMHLIQRKLRGYIQQDLPQTASTVADQQRYHYPQNIMPPITSATWTIASIAYPLTVVSSQFEWDAINQIDFSGTTTPTYIFPMRDHFELWPTPSTAGETITLIASLLDRDMTIEDFTTNTVTVTNNDATITHSGTSFTAAMAGRWFQTTDDQFWYRIASFTDTSNMELESVFEGTTAGGASYTIGEVPEIPVELHSLLPSYAAAQFYAGPRKDSTTAQVHMNFFYTGDYTNPSRDPSNVAGGLLDGIRRYSRRSDSKLIDKGVKSISRFDERFSSTLSSAI